MESNNKEFILKFSIGNNWMGGINSILNTLEILEKRHPNNKIIVEVNFT